MALDMIYASKLPSGMSLVLEMTSYKGGATNQEEKSVVLEQGQYIDYFKLKNGDSSFGGMDLRDFIVRRIILKR
jgi:hypothetical protein